MEVVLIGDKQIKLEILRIIVFLYTVVPRGIAVFLFSTKYNIYLYISTLFPYKYKYVGCQYNALRYIQVRHFLPITAKFVLSVDLLSCLNAKSQTEQEECQANFTPKKIFILENGKHKEITYQEFLKLKADKEAYGNRKFVGAQGMIFEAEEKLYRDFYAYKRRLLYTRS
ncbi:MAG: hypothetical protein ACI4LX_03925 [Treponema sp.]